MYINTLLFPMISRCVFHNRICVRFLSTSSISIYKPDNIILLKPALHPLNHKRSFFSNGPLNQPSIMATSSNVQLSLSDYGVFHTSGITKESAAKASEVLQDNHEHHHIFFNQSGFHSTYNYRNRPCVIVTTVYHLVFHPRPAPFAGTILSPLMY